MSKRFKADVSDAAERATNHGLPGITSIERSDGDAILIVLEHQNRPQGIRVVAHAQDPSSYPGGNMFLLFTVDDDTPEEVVKAIASFDDSGLAVGLTVTEVAVEMVKRVDGALSKGTDDSHPKPMSLVDEEQEDEYLSGDEDGSDMESDQEDADSIVMSDSDDDASMLALTNHASFEVMQSLRQRVLHDLDQAEQAGYKVDIIDGLEKRDRFVTMSLTKRVHHFDLPPEVLEAWDVTCDEYVVLLIRFEGFYQPLEQVLEQAPGSKKIRFRFGKCDQYKPSRESVAAAFSRMGSDGHLHVMGTSAATEAAFRKVFVSNSLDQFLNQSYLSLLRLREKKRYSWDQANDELLSQIGKSLSVEARGTESPLTDQDFHEEDHQLKVGGENRSFPLISMQFATRYFVRCTEYCLRCHCRLDKGFQALRPYVCSDPLCLWQYIAMGMGPDVEYEILTEPYVVDLLVCLCYASIIRPTNPKSGQQNSGSYPIRVFPSGLRLRVPNLFQPGAALLQGVLLRRDQIQLSSTSSFPVSLQPKMWIAVRPSAFSGAEPELASVIHGIIRSINQQTRSIDFEPMEFSAKTWFADGLLDTLQPGQNVNIYPYERDFDLLDDDDKALAMRHILDTLPAIMDIEFFLSQDSDRTLRSMDAVSPAAESLLRWIVASNRSCILQVDRCRSIEGVEEDIENQRPAGRGRNREHERIGGKMTGWAQFRFAQGAVDKERRFKQAIYEVAARKGMTTDLTMFAWHGSSLYNWHSILRSGLDFQEIQTGRAQGDGVYFSPRFDESKRYARPTIDRWANSNLDVQNVVSLNEIINAPDEFVCVNPHYVVSQLDWHQCRYLFVKTRGVSSKESLLKYVRLTLGTKDAPLDVDAEALDYYITQPQGKKIKGPGNKDLEIPRAALPSRRILVGSTPSHSVSAQRNRWDSDEHSKGRDDSDRESTFLHANDTEEEQPLPWLPVVRIG